MSVFKTAYDTTLGSLEHTEQITRAIKEAFVRDFVYNTNLEVITSLAVRPVFINGSQSSEGNIPLFAHPILVEQKGMQFLVTDVRSFVRHDTKDGNYEPAVKNLTEFNFAKSRAILNLGWLTGSIDSMRSNMKFAGAVFAAWISETIAKRYALDPADQMKITVVSLYYYFSLFEEEAKMGDDFETVLTMYASKMFKMPAKTVGEIISQVEKVGNLDEFCETIKTVTQNIRLQDFSTGVLMTITASSWFGTNSKQILSISLEHPPTWIAIVAASLNERTFKNSLIARISERYSRGGAAAEFISSVADLIEYHIEKKQRSVSDIIGGY